MTCHIIEATIEIIEELRKIIRDCDIVICTTDNKASRLLINRICVEENVKCIFSGAFTRAYGGQVMVVRPHETMCLQCFYMHNPGLAKEEEVSNKRQLEQFGQYADRPVHIEPGLSIDISNLSSMTARIALQMLLEGKETSLDTLSEDLVASWYVWINRREKGTQYEGLEPLEYNVDGFHILRWYGIKIDRHPECPVCGNFIEAMKEKYGI